MGNVRTVARQTLGRWGKMKTSPGRLHKTETSRLGYKRATLSKNGKATKKLVHRLVAEAFIPNPLENKTVNHINGIKADNTVANLEWLTPSQNTRHAFDTGLIKAATGDRNNMGRRTHCNYGHPYSGGNLATRTDGKYTYRVCKTCRAATARKSRAKQKRLRDVLSGE